MEGIKSNLEEQKNTGIYIPPIQKGWTQKDYLCGKGTRNGLYAVGWIYFLLGLLGGLILIFNSKETHYERGSLYSIGETVTTTNYFNLAFGVVGIISCAIVLLLCLGLARVMEQNIYLINKEN